MINHSSTVTELDTGKIVKMVLALQLAVFVVFGLSMGGVSVPILRQLIGFLYLVFVPGILILIVLRVRVPMAETILYAIGLSVSFLTITSLFVNSVYPLFGIKNPISMVPLMATISPIVIILCLFILLRRKAAVRQTQQHFNLISFLFDKTTLFIVLLFLLSILGAYLTHFYNSNVLLLIVLVLMASIPILAVLGRIPANLLPFAVFVIALSLIYQQALASSYLWGRDILIEYYYANIVRAGSYWDPTIPVRINAMLGDVMLPAALSHLLGMDLTWVFKLIYPFLYSLIPLSLYQIASKHMDARLAFLASFLFASFSGYRLLGLAEIKILMATVFLSLLVLSMLNRSMNRTNQAALVMVFSFSLITSHYSTSYIFIVSSFAVLVITLLYSKLRKTRVESGGSFISANFVLLYTVAAFAWYMYIARGDAFSNLVSYGEFAFSQITELFSPTRGGAVQFATSALPSPLYNTLKILYFVTQFFIVVGFLGVAYQKWRGKETESRFDDEHFFYSAVFLGWLASAIVVPSLTSAEYSIGTQRLYVLSLFFLAPFCLVGGAKTIALAQKVFYKLKKLRLPRPQPVVPIALAVFLAVFFLFDTEAIMEAHQEISGGRGYCTSLNLAQPRIRAGKASQQEALFFYSHYTPEVDVFGARWLGKYKDERKQVIVDLYLVPQIYGIPMGQLEEAGKYGMTRDAIERAFGDRYIYLREANVRYGVDIKRDDLDVTKWEATDFYASLEGNNKIYSNGGCEIYD